MWVDPNLPGQVGVPLEHSTAHHQNPTHWSRGCPTGVEHTAHHLNPTNWSSECPTGIHSIPSKPYKLVKWVSRWNKLLTTKTPQTGQEGVAQEHTAHQPNPTNWPSNFQSAASTWPVYFCVALASTSIHPWWGLAIQLLHVGTKQSKASETKLACLTNMHNRPNVLSCYPWKCVCLFTSLEKKTPKKPHLHANDSKIGAYGFQKWLPPVIPFFAKYNTSAWYFHIFCSRSNSLAAYKDFFQRIENAT